MKWFVSIIDTETGRLAVVEDESDLDDDVFVYLWSDGGNFSCDCNRASFFARARGEPEPVDPPCGDSRYRAPYAISEDGRRLELDGEEVTAEAER